MEWKPIETAPRDGKHVLILCPGNRQAVAMYEDAPFIGDGWHVVVPCVGMSGHGTETFIRWEEDQPTHWMPLPEAPKD